MKVTMLLVPLDGSQTAEAALPYAEAIARATKASLCLLGVVEAEPRLSQGGGPRDVWQYLGRAGEAAMTEYLSSVAAAVRERGLSVTTHVTHGDPADTIAAEADATPGAVIVMATHGRGGLDRWLIGSVADKVMRIATRPTLLVRPPQAAPAARVITLRRIMVPLDGSELAEMAVAPAAELAQATGAILTLVRVEPWLAATAALYGYTPALDHMDAEAAATAERYLDTLKGQLPPTIRVERVVLRGTPASMLESFALEEEVDLVVMTTHGRGGLRRLVMGSTADRLVRAGVPTLLIRPSALGVSAGGTATGTTVHRCATCGRLITFAFDPDTRCPRCQTHLHTCANCVFWDTIACVLQRPEAHDPRWAGWHCRRFTFRETPATEPGAAPAARTS